MKPPILLFVATLLSAAAAPTEAAPPAAAPATVENRATELVKRQLELTFQLQDQMRKNEGQWMDPRFTSPEIEALRQRHRRLAAEMGEVQVELRRLVAALPEAQTEQAKVERLRAEYQELGRQIEARKKDKGPSVP